jgi:hypothetical protein
MSADTGFLIFRSLLPGRPTLERAEHTSGKRFPNRVLYTLCTIGVNLDLLSRPITSLRVGRSLWFFRLTRRLPFNYQLSRPSDLYSRGRYAYPDSPFADCEGDGSGVRRNRHPLSMRCHAGLPCLELGDTPGPGNSVNPRFVVLEAITGKEYYG